MSLEDRKQTVGFVGLGQMGAERGIDLLDAPVTGMEKGAKAGTLKAYVGGDAAALEQVRPVLQADVCTRWAKLWDWVVRTRPPS
jgi:NAD binding domain of 6-phosphogluconate dehydrogenase